MSLTGLDRSPAESGAEINLYEELSLERDSDTDALLGQLRMIKIGWGAKAARAGDTGEKARAALDLIQRAEVVFATDASREEYDVCLRHAPQQPEAASEIDWLPRAWNYYFVKDEGAAGVAARKAKEQNADNPLAYVVSAWVNLMSNDVRAAKRDADEAFVLDELGEETADVHHVRGVVFFEQQFYDRAMQSFDRALGSAGLSEQVEINMRRAWVFERLHRFDDMFNALETALSIDTEITDFMRRQLDRTVYIAIEHLVGGRRGAEARSTLNALTERVRGSRMSEPSKQRILDFLAIALQKAAAEETAEQLAGVTPPQGVRAGVPIKRIVALVVVLLLALDQSFFFLVALGLGAWVGFAFYKRQAFQATVEEFNSAQRRLAETHGQIGRYVEQMSALTQRHALAPGFTANGA